MLCSYNPFPLLLNTLKPPIINIPYMYIRGWISWVGAILVTRGFGGVFGGREYYSYICNMGPYCW